MIIAFVFISSFCVFLFFFFFSSWSPSRPIETRSTCYFLYLLPRTCSTVLLLLVYISPPLLLLRLLLLFFVAAKPFES